MLLDQIHGLRLALRVIEQCNRNIEPDRYTYVIRESLTRFPCRSGELCSISYILQILYETR